MRGRVQSIPSLELPFATQVIFLLAIWVIAPLTEPGSAKDPDAVVPDKVEVPDHEAGVMFGLITWD